MTVCFAKKRSSFPCLSPCRLRYGAALSAGHCPPAPARRGRWRSALSALKALQQRAAIQLGTNNRALHHHITTALALAWRNPSAIVGSSADNSAQAYATAVAHGAGDDVIYLRASSVAPARRVYFAADAGMLMASAADAKMGLSAAPGAGLCNSRRFTCAGLFLSSTSSPACSWGSTPLTSAPGGGNTRPEGIEESLTVNGYDLARRHAPFGR